MDIKQLTNLLCDKDFSLELKAYRCAYQRLKIRIRNNQFTSQLKQLSNMTKLLQKTYSVDLLKSYNNKLFQYKSENKDKKILKKKQHLLRSYLNYLNQMIILIDKLIDKSLQIYAQTQPRLKVGHLIHHYLIVKTSIARLRICFKALLIYSCDLYIDIYKQFNYKGQSLPDCNVIREILLKNNCKPAADDSVGSSTRKEDESIGQLIDRKTMKPISKKDNKEATTIELI